MKLRWFAQRYLTCRPRVFVVEPTNRCNMRCEMCPSHSGQVRESRPVGDMPLAQYVEIVGEISRWLDREGIHRGFIVAHGAGEPLLHPHFLEILQTITQQGNLLTGFLTNGRLLTESQIPEIVHTGVAEIGISINGTNSENYQARCGVDGWNKVMENLAALRRFRDRSSESHPFIRVQTVPENDGSGELTRFVSDMLEYADEVVVQVRRDVTGRGFHHHIHHSWIRRRPCHRLVEPLTIGWNGDVHLCCEDWHGEHVLGNLRDDTLKTILARRRKFLQMHRNGRGSEIPLCTHCINWMEPDIRIRSLDGVAEIESPLWKRIRKV